MTASSGSGALSVRRWLPALACTECSGGLAEDGGSLVCVRCATRFEIRNGVPILLHARSAAAIGAARSRAENVALRQRMGRSPALLRLADALRPPHPFAFMRSRVSTAQRAAFSQIAAANVTARGGVPLFLDIGSGILGGLNSKGLSALVRDNVLPLEIAPTTGVGVVGDAHRLPFQDGVADGLLIQGVLEHVEDPVRIAAEIHRVLRPGAPVYVEIPFLQHFHLDPIDWRRWTLDGLRQLFGAFDIADAGVCAGPAATVTDVLTEFPAVLFRNPVAYWGVKSVAGWLFSPIQLLDAFWAGRPRAHSLSAALYLLGAKPFE